MKEVVITRSGGPEVLEVIERSIPEPGPGQVLVQAKAVGVNFADIVAREGNYPVAPPPPFVPGYEAAGIVTAIGPGVTLPIGTRVAALLPKFGGYAEYVVSDADRTIPLPDSISFTASTALLVQGLTAYLLLERAAQQPGQSVLISGAAGGVGSLLVQIAKKRGAVPVIGLVSTQEKAAQARELGADATVLYTRSGWSEEVHRTTDGKGVDIYLDATGDITEDTQNVLADGGKWVLYGLQKGDGQLTAAHLGRMLFHNLSLVGFSLSGVTPEEIGRALGQLLQWAAAGELEIIASDTFPLTEAAEAHRAVIERRTMGKVNLIP